MDIRRTCRVISAGQSPLSCGGGPHVPRHRTGAFQKGLQPLTSRLKTAAREPEAEGDTQLVHNKEPGSRARCRPPGGFGNSERPGRGFGEPQPITRGPSAGGGAWCQRLCGQAGSEHPAASDPPGRDMASVRASPRGALLLLLAAAGVAEVTGGLAPGSAGE